jgi:hypothetical protein
MEELTISMRKKVFAAQGTFCSLCKGTPAPLSIEIRFVASLLRRE